MVLVFFNVANANTTCINLHRESLSKIKYEYNHSGLHKQMQKESAMQAEDPGSLSQPRSSLSH